MKKLNVVMFMIILSFGLISCISTNPYDDYISADPNLPAYDVEIGSSFDIIGPSEFQGYVGITLYEPDTFLILINQNDKKTNQRLFSDRLKVLKHVNSLCKKRGDEYHSVTTIENYIVVFDANKDRSSYNAKSAASKTTKALANLLSGVSGKEY